LFARTGARQTDNQHKTWFPFLLAWAGFRQTIIIAEVPGFCKVGGGVEADSLNRILLGVIPSEAVFQAERGI
jgi:hypothetical protein